jgi:hypothetical protein
MEGGCVRQWRGCKRVDRVHDGLHVVKPGRGRGTFEEHETGIRNAGGEASRAVDGVPLELPAV